MRHISQVERIALRDHEAIAEARREYEPDVTRIAAAMLGSYAQNQVVHTVASVFAVLWDQAHRLDPQRAGTAGWICHLARRESLACLRAGLPSGSVQFPDEPRFRILTLELSGLPTGSSAELNGILRQLPDADRRLLVRRYGCYEDLDAMALAARVDRGVLESRLADARTRLTAIWDASSSPSRPMALSDWDMLDPDLLPDAVPDTPMRLDPVSLPPAEQRSPLFSTENDSRTHFAKWPLPVLALVLLIAGFAVGFSLHPWNNSPPTVPIVPTGPTGPSNSTPAISHVAVNPFPLTPLLDFDWDTLSAITVVRTDADGIGMDSYRLQDRRDINNLRSFLDGFRFEHSILYSEITVSDFRLYKLTAEDPRGGVSFFGLADGRVVATGAFLRNATGLTDPNAVLVSYAFGSYQDWDFDRLALYLDSLKETRR